MWLALPRRVPHEEDAPTRTIRVRAPHERSGETDPTGVFWNRAMPHPAVVKLAHPRLIPRPQVMPLGTNSHPAQRPEADDFLDEAITTQLE
jgi:hypothetical protein